MAKVNSVIPNADQIANRLRSYALKGQYKEGSELAQRILKTYPGDFYFTYQYAKLLGDWGDDLPLRQRKKIKEKAAKILKPLTRKLNGKQTPFRFGVCLNYYYQSYAFRNMLRYGKRLIATDRRLGLYAQALAASQLAEENYHLNKLVQAKKWAEKSVQFWKLYGLKGEPYYFPFYCLALSWVVLGNKEQAMANLKVAAKLSQRKINCAEFREILDLIQAG